jgi:integrase
MADLLLLLDHEIKGRTETVKFLVVHLRDYFGFDKAMAITTDRILGYVRARREEGAADGIKLELAALSRAFNLAIAAEMLTPHARPDFPKIILDDARQGFIDYANFIILKDNLPAHLKDSVGFLFFSGWRVPEMRLIEWKHVDPSGKSLHLPPNLSKNKHGRLLPLTGELAAIIQRARERRRLDRPQIFHHNGRAIGDFKKA